MAWMATCPGCAFGHHEQHDRNWNITPGLIGGAWCPCEGEPGCTERYEVAAERLLRDMFGDQAIDGPASGEAE